jgi:hypothetical protein
MSDDNKERERLADEALGRDADNKEEKEDSASGPWAKTSSGDADSVTEDDGD